MTMYIPFLGNPLRIGEMLESKSTISDKEMLVHNRLTGEQINIIGVPTLKITFKTDEIDSAGQIVVFVDQKSKKVLGSVPRK